MEANAPAGFVRQAHAGRLTDLEPRPNLHSVRRLTGYAWFTLFFNVVVILLGARVRSTGSGAGCGRSWPTCQGRVIPELEGATGVEYLHRTASGLALVLVVALAILVWRNVERGAPARLGAGLAVVSIVGEALIGAMIVLAEWVAEDASIARVVAVPLHLVNTLFLLASLTLTAFWLSGGRRLAPTRHPAVWKWVALGGLAIILLAATGAITALADTLFPKDGESFLVPSPAHFLTDLRVIHPILAVLAASIGWLVSGRARSPRPKAARLLPVLVGLMLLSGSLNIALGVPVWLQLVHLLLADLLWVTYVLASADVLQQPIDVDQTV